MQYKKIYLRLQGKLVGAYIYDDLMTFEKGQFTTVKYKNYRHCTPVQLRFKDVDALGHVNNANHFTYLELARIHYFNDVISKSNNWNQNGLILAKMSVDYIKPIVLTDSVFAFTKCSRIGNKSFDLEYALTRQVKGEFENVANGYSVIVCFDYSIQQSIPVPENWRKRILDFDFS